jgi:hypothetical protein
MPKNSTTTGSSLTENKIIDCSTTHQAQNLKILRTEIDNIPKLTQLGISKTK